MYNVYSFGLLAEHQWDYGLGLSLVAAETPEEAVSLLGWGGRWQHPDNCDKTVKVLEGVKSDRKGVLEHFFAYI